MKNTKIAISYNRQISEFIAAISQDGKDCIIRNQFGAELVDEIWAKFKVDVYFNPISLRFTVPTINQF